MPRRVILTARQRATLFDLPTDEAAILRHYIFSDTDLALVKRRQGAANQIGFGLQLCAFRYPGRLIQPGEIIPKAMLDFVAGQLGVSADEADRYAVTGTTRYRHSADLQRLLGYRPCSGRARDDLIDWLIEIAGSAKANVDLAAACIKEMRRRKIIVPAPTTVERLCASALTTAESQTLSTIARRLDECVRARLTMLLTNTGNSQTSQFVWLRRYEVGNNTADMHRLLDRLDLLNRLGLKVEVINDLPRRQIDRLRGEGERLSADHLKKTTANSALCHHGGVSDRMACLTP